VLKHLCFFILAAAGCSAQVEFTMFPQPLHFFPRTEAGSGTFTVAGKVTGSKPLKLRVMLLNTTDSLQVSDTTISVNNGVFSMSGTIPAVLREHRLSVFARDQHGNDSLVKTVDGLVCGDAFLVMGQSNAENSAGEEDARLLDSLYSHFCCRTIGWNYSWAGSQGISAKDDARFRRPSSLGWASGIKGFTGMWPLKLQYDLAKATGIPVCIVNGSQGASLIRHHQASGTPSDPMNLRDGSHGETAWLYDRVFSKFYLTGLTPFLKGIFWYQGESDGNLDEANARNYPVAFDSLRTSWKLDYPGLEKIFILQLNTGCGGNYLDLMRQLQADIADKYDDVEIMSTVGSRWDERSADGCHYSAMGAAALGAKLAPLVRKSIYQHALSADSVLPPKLVGAEYHRPAILVLTFDKQVLAQQYEVYGAGADTAFLKDHFFDQLDRRIEVKSVHADGEKIFLALAEDRQPESVTYLPDVFTAIPTVYFGPWILNAKNTTVGALSFYKMPVLLKAGDEESDLIVYPNPVSGRLYVAGSKEKMTASFISPEGRTGPEQDVVNGTIEVSALKAGVYVMKLKRENDETYFRVIVK
jgi:hypothetical protein